MKIKHLSAFDVVGPLCGKKDQIDEIYASFCIEDTGGSARDCNVNSISEADLLHRLGTYCDATFDVFFESGSSLLKHTDEGSFCLHAGYYAVLAVKSRLAVLCLFLGWLALGN